MVTRVGFHHVSLRVLDLEKSIAFYEAIGGKKYLDLKLELPSGVRKGVMLEFGNDSYMEIFEGGKGLKEENPRYVHVSIRSLDCQADYDAAVAAGGIGVTAPSPDCLGEKKTMVGFVKGPDGETLEILQEL